MGPDEYEPLLHDAEVKLARLRALYEQYFQGIEKLEPTVPRKELDRAIELLKKNQPRNTALRFRLQMLGARYGTYQTYWQRVTRQIEEGTFRRDVVRAQQRRLREQAQAQRAWELDVDVEEPEAAAAPPIDDSDVDAILGALSPMKTVPPTARRSLSPLSAFAGRASAPSPVPIVGSPPSPAAARPAPVAAAPAVPSSAVAPASPAPPPAAAAAPARTGVSFAKPKEPPRPAAVGVLSEPPPPMDGRGAVAPSPPKPPALAVPRPGAVVVPRPGGPPAPPAAAGARPVPPPPPAARGAPPAPPARPPAAPAAAPAARDLDAARIRTIYDDYVAARRKNNEADVRFETVEQSVRQMLPKLREKHGNRPIDFEVVVSNGKVGLKPKVG